MIIIFFYIDKLALQIKEDGGSRVIERLDNLWRIFDNLCIMFGVQKIEVFFCILKQLFKTVGYTYMAALGINACEESMNPIVLSKDKYFRALHFTFAMKKVVEKVKWGPNNNK